MRMGSKQRGFDADCRWRLYGQRQTLHAIPAGRGNRDVTVSGPYAVTVDRLAENALTDLRRRV